MAANENSEEVSTACDREIADLLQADLNLRTSEWENSSSGLISHEANEVQEEICESFIEEIVVQQKNDSYIAGIDEECMEESIVYVFEEPVVELELSDSHYIIQEPQTFEMEDSEAIETDIIDSTSHNINKNEENDCVDNVLSEENIICENNIVQETSKEEFENKSVNICSENELDVNKCTVSLSLPSDNSIKSCNFNENSDSLEYNLTESAVVEENDTSDALVQVFSLYGEDDPVTNIVIEPIIQEEIPVIPKSVPNPEPEIDVPSESISSQILAPPTPTVQMPPNMVPSILNKNKMTPIRKITSNINSPIETKSPQSDSSLSPGLKTLGKDQIKKRLQSFSLLKQGIKPIPIKKIVSPKQPKVQTQIEEVYDETGRKIDEKCVIKKPPKQGPTPSEKARQVIDEIEQIKREEAAIYEQNLLFMKYSMRDAHRKKSKYRRRDRSKSPVRRQNDKRIRRVSGDDKSRKSLENDKHRKSPENTKCDKIKKDKSLEKETSKNIGMPKSWAEIKQNHIDFDDIKIIKEKIFKFTEDPRCSPISTNKKGKKKKLKQQLLQKQLERNISMKKEDFVKPQLIFEHPSVLRTSLIALSVTGSSKCYPPELIRFTEKLPSISYCENPNKSTILYKTREQVLSEVPEERISHMMKIIENQTEPVKTPRYVTTSWYSPHYLKESNEPEVPISYGLSVLTEMYNDEQEEIHETDPEKHMKHSKGKKKSKKHKKHKSKSKSRSSSKEKSQKHIDKNVDENDEYQEKNSKDEIIGENIFTEDKGEETPNTDEYRSNWESDEDLLNEIMPNDRRSYNKSYQKSLNDSWGIEERQDKYDRRNFDENRRSRINSSMERSRIRPEEEKRYESRKSTDLRLEFEDRNTTMNRISEERIFSRHSYDRIDNKWSIESKREMEDYENRHTVLKNPSRYNFESDDRDKRRHYSESDNRKSRESLEKVEFDRQRNMYESDRYRKSEDFIDNIEINRQRRSNEMSEQEVDKRSRYSLEHDKKRISDFKEEKLRHDSSYSRNSLHLEKKTRDRHESEENSNSSSKYKTEERLHKSRENKLSVSSDSDKKHDGKLERNIDSEHGKNANVRHENIPKNMYHKWSSDEDIHKSVIKHDKKKSENQHKKCIDESIDLNINYKLQRSQWSSEEEDDRKKCVDNRRYINYEDDLQFAHKEKSKSDQYTNSIENILNDDLMNLKDLQRNRLLAEEKHYLTKDEEEYEGSTKRKSRMEMLEDEQKERYKKDKKKNKDKKMKNRKRDKVPTVQITYSDFEESFDEDFQTAKQKEQSLIVPNAENAKKHAAKIKIDYSDFDLSLSESKDKYAKKIEEKIQASPEISKTVDANQIPKERKMNIDLSEIFVEHHSPVVKNIEIEITTTKLQSPQPSYIKTTLETSQIKPPISNISKLPISAPEKTIDEYMQETLTPTISKMPEEYIEQKTPTFGKSGTTLEIAGISSIIPKNSSDTSVMLTPTVSTINIMQEISPVAPPVTPVTPDASKLVSEYEEFMKAVSFDEPKEDNINIQKTIPAATLETPEENLQKNDIESNKQVEIEREVSKSEESNSSTEESSSDYDTSSEEGSDSSSDSESLSPDSARKKILETVANIKTEKVTDSENESQDSKSEKRKRKEDSPENDSLQDVVIKIEKENKKMRKSEEIKTFDCESKYDNVIDWEKSCVEDTNIHLYNDYSTDTNKYSHLKLPIIDICDMIPPNVLPENIPLPIEKLTGITPIQNISDYSVGISSPTDIITISSDNSTPSPVKKPRSFIPIKLLTAESRKQANETAKLVPSDQSNAEIKGTQENFTSVESSNDIFELNQEILSTSQSGSTEDLEQGGLRKRKSQWNLNISPAKKPLLHTSIGEDDSDEDFTDKFIKQSDKKPDKLKKEEENKDKENIEIVTKESDPKPEPSIRDEKKDDNKSAESRKNKDDDDKSRRSTDKLREKSRHSPDRHKDDHKDRRSLSPKSEKEKRTSRRNSRERIDKHDKYDRNDRRDKIRSPERKRDRSRETVRDRDNRRLSDRRLSDRKQPYTRGRSPRSRYSREREIQRARPRERSKDRVIRQKEFERDRSRERDKSRERDRPREIIRERERSRDRDHRERDERKTYRRDDRRYSRSPSPHRKDYREMEHIPPPHKPDDTDFSTTNMDIVQSPVNSPLDGFKRSLADSTISDSELITQLNTPDESNEPSPAYSHLPPQQYYPASVHEIPPQCHQSPSSPKRISLDDRINLVLGIEKEPPKSIDTVCTRGPYANSNPQNYELYNYGRTEYDLYNSQNQPSEGYGPPYSTQYQSPYYPNTENNVKVVQVGNVIQVVPTEQPQPVPVQATPVPKPTEVPPKVVQVGNMLQIVPMTIIETAVVSSPITSVAPIPVPEKPIVPKATDQLTLERRAEKEKRRQEREVRRKEKERKRKEKEKRRQLKIKTKTENMIKRALLLETGEGELDISNIDTEAVSESNDNNNVPMSWPPASSLTIVPLPKAPGKGILVSHGFREKDDSFEDTVESKKVVKFADGICPGEGTSPSGGEELPSPPPPPRKLPKEKRYNKKIKNKNKKKIKVKIIRTQQQSAEDESSEEDNLPPPPPPPGSPPIHLWPPRIKQPPVNNIHPSLPSSVFPHPTPTYAAPQQMMYPPAFPPIATGSQSVPVVVSHAPPPAAQRQHHPPVMPVLQTGVPPPPPHHGAHQSSFHH